MNQPIDIYNIVVLGAMNPRIHTPAWYRLAKLISEEEFNISMLSPEVMTLPMGSQFRINEFMITCQLDRWEVQCHSLENLSRLRAIACKAFDELLPHTPVGAMGYNFIYQRETAVSDIGRFLAKRLSHPSFNLGVVDPALGSMSITQVNGNRSLQVGLMAVPPEPASFLQVSNSYEHRFISDPTSFQLFNLADTLDKFYEDDRKDAEQRLSSVLAAIEKAGV